MNIFNQVYSIIRTHKRITDFPKKDKSETAIIHPVIWLRIGEPYEVLEDAIVAKDKLDYPEDYIILPHY